MILLSVIALALKVIGIAQRADRALEDTIY